MRPWCPEALADPASTTRAHRMTPLQWEEAALDVRVASERCGRRPCRAAHCLALLDLLATLHLHLVQVQGVLQLARLLCVLLVQLVQLLQECKNLLVAALMCALGGQLVKRLQQVAPGHAQLQWCPADVTGMLEAAPIQCSWAKAVLFLGTCNTTDMCMCTNYQAPQQQGASQCCV